MKLIGNSKWTNKTPTNLTDITRMITSMDMFPSPDYKDISEIVENKNPLDVLKVSFTIAKLPYFSTGTRDKGSTLWGSRGFPPRSVLRGAPSVPSPLDPSTKSSAWQRAGSQKNTNRVD